VTKRTLLLLALAATTGVPALAACGASERQAPLPPSAAGSNAVGSLPPGTTGGYSGPQDTGGRQIPTSGSVGANVTPAPSDSTGGLRTRPGYVPGPAGTTTLPSDSYRVGTRAPWGILLDDRPDPAPAPVPQVRNHRDTPPRDAGDGVLILADKQPALARVRPAGPDRTFPELDGTPPGLDRTPPGQATKDDPSSQTVGETPDVASNLSFPALLAVLPPPISPDPANQAENRSGDHKASKHHPTAGTDDVRPTSADPAAPGEATATTTTTTDLSLPQPGLPAGAVPAPIPPTTTLPSPAPPSPAPQPAQPAIPTGTGWHLDGLSLSNVAPQASGKNGSAAFRKALRASLQARPAMADPGAAELGRWSASLQKAATVAPDARTKQQLRTLSRYAAELARTPAPERAALQAKRPGAIHAASVLRAALPGRFGVSLLD
jgi:hypothetical protein